LWFGKTPGFAGLNQINVQVPEDTRPSAKARLIYLQAPEQCGLSPCAELII
jgi:uncharacterized protein (TIGR03437 family)